VINHLKLFNQIIQHSIHTLLVFPPIILV